jgi:DNA-binding MarR family transcriptional regulator
MSITPLSPSTVEESFLTFITFLMTAKRRVVEIGTTKGLTGMQTMILFLLDAPRPMNSFTKILNCDASNVTGIVDGLQQKKLVLRCENPDDRRIKMVELDTKGKQVRAELLRELAKAEGPILTALSPAEFKTFIKLLDKINRSA